MYEQQSGSGQKLLYVAPATDSSRLCEAFAGAGWKVHRTADMRAARRLIIQHRFAVGLLVYPDLGDDQAAEMETFLAAHTELEWVGCFDSQAVHRPACRDIILAHLFDHHTLPVDVARVTACIGHAYGRAALRKAAGEVKARRKPAGDPGDAVIVGRSAAIVEVLRQARRIAQSDAPVLVCGESGSGKELVAQTVHRNSARSKQPFVAINCGAIQSSLIQSELFGHERGAFTGALAEKRGYFEAADGGTLFLDEIGDLPLEFQVNLLRFLQEGTINRVGSSRVVKLDVRVIAATNVDLVQAIAAGRFRQDLLFRLDVLPLRVPPLRERREDIAMLAEHAFVKFNAEKSAKLKGFSRIAIQALEAHTWPGNVRELINRVRCSMIMAQGKFITPVDLGLEAVPTGEELQNVLGDARMLAESEAIRSTLLQTGRNVAVSARQLGVSRMTLYRLMVKHGINSAT